MRDGPGDRNGPHEPEGRDTVRPAPSREHVGQTRWPCRTARERAVVLDEASATCPPASVQVAPAGTSRPRHREVVDVLGLAMAAGARRPTACARGEPRRRSRTWNAGSTAGPLSVPRNRRRRRHTRRRRRSRGGERVGAAAGPTRAGQIGDRAPDAGRVGAAASPASTTRRSPPRSGTGHVPAARRRREGPQRALPLRRRGLSSAAGWESSHQRAESTETSGPTASGRAYTCRSIPSSINPSAPSAPFHSTLMIWPPLQLGRSVV